MPGKLIVLTGLDGSGTSSVAEELQKIDPNSSQINSIAPPYTNSKNEINEIVGKASPAAHYLFYLSALVYLSELITEKIKRGNVYCVRHLIDTVVSHRVAGLNVDLLYETDSYIIHKPDLIIFLDIDENLRQERINRRGKGFLDKKLDNDEFRAKFLKEFNRLSHCFTKVQVLNKSVTEIAREIQNLLN